MQINRRVNMRKFNRLKDILVDHVFDYCFNEVVQKIESPGVNIIYDDPEGLDTPAMKQVIDTALKSEKFSGTYTVRNVKYCEILVDNNTIHKSLSERLELLGFKKAKRLNKKIEKAQNHLIARSYLSRNKPIETKVKLTEKGLRHYLDGKSFEDEFTARRNSIIALVVSLISLLISGVALWS